MESTVLPFPQSLAVPSPWWEQGVIYQVYLRSFQDGNGRLVKVITNEWLLTREERRG